MTLVASLPDFLKRIASIFLSERMGKLLLSNCKKSASDLLVLSNEQLLMQ